MKNRPFHRRLGFALAGIACALRSENSFRVQVLAAAAALVALVYLRPAPMWWAIVGVATMAVLVAELFNTAVEHLADHLHPEQHPSIRIVKDCAAAAVFVAVLGALCVAAAFICDWLSVFDRG